MSRSRSERREQAAAAKRRARHLAQIVWRLPEDELTDRFVGKVASTHGAACSCYACTAPRRRPASNEWRADLLDDEEPNGDGFGDPTAEVTGCEPPSRTVAPGLEDHDDVRPGLRELCDAVDHDGDADADAGSDGDCDGDPDMERQGGP